MDATSYSNAKQGLLAAAFNVAPSKREQDAFSRMLTELERDGNEPKTVLSRMASAIIDGLEYGNWPE